MKLTKGQAKYDGALAATDDKYRSKKYAKIITVELEEGKTYQIDHMSKAFDAYLYLEDPDGELLAQDDDSGGGLNSRIVHRASQSGTYRLIATGFGDCAPGNAFSLSVRMLPDADSDMPEGPAVVVQRPRHGRGRPNRPS